jgi:4'-phosphopantetheinyl transferase
MSRRVGEPGEVGVWWMECGAPPAGLPAHWRACLDPMELTKADRFRFDGDRTTYIAAHWLLRQALACVGGRSPEEWRFVAEPNGKPRLDRALGPAGLEFNLSHTRGFVACAVGFGGMIGIDVEACSRTPANLDIAERFFSAPEVAILRRTPAKLRPETFLRLWTLKEAFIKATGEGLTRALDSFSLSLDPVSIAFNPDRPDEGGRWSFIERRPTPDHLLALAVRPSGPWLPKVSVRSIQPPNLFDAPSGLETVDENAADATRTSDRHCR